MGLTAGLTAVSLRHGQVPPMRPTELFMNLYGCSPAMLRLLQSEPKSRGLDVRCTSKVVEVPVTRRIPIVQDFLGSPRPVAGDAAAGYGVAGEIAAVPDWQPLAHEGIWRVALHGEAVVRIVRCSTQPDSTPHWALLQMDDMTDEQLDTYEEALSDLNQSGDGSGHSEDAERK